jgi:hypothetical protein
VWTTITPTKFTQDFAEEWVLRDGDQFARASLGFRLPKDRVALLDALWQLKPGRYVVLHHDLNGTVRVMGSKDEPATLRVQQVKHGADPRREGNRYVAMVEVSRRTECPFYLGTPPVPSGNGISYVPVLATVAPHAPTHHNGGSDPIKLDDLAIPDDNTDLDATVTRHGLLPRLSGNTSHALKGDGTWGNVGGVARYTESLVGVINGSNASFTTTQDFIPASIKVYVNGLLQLQPGGYSTIGNDSILFTSSPLTGDELQATYDIL